MSDKLKMYGKIKWYDDRKKYGYITSYDNNSYFFINRNKDINYEKMEEVKFIPVFQTNLEVATEVEKVSKSL